jgi:hypothetical protein
MQYSVLLKYPEAMTDGELETYYTFVEAEDVPHAVHAARIAAASRQGYSLSDFALLLVIEGHHPDYSLPQDHATALPEEMVTCRYCDTATPKAYAGPNKSGDGWIGECCWEDYQDDLAEED